MYSLHLTILIPDTVPPDAAVRHFTAGLNELACDLTRSATVPSPQRSFQMAMPGIAHHPGPKQRTGDLDFVPNRTALEHECERLAREIQSVKRENLALRASLEQRPRTTEELAGQVAERVRRHPTKPKTGKKPQQGKNGRFVKVR